MISTTLTTAFRTGAGFITRIVLITLSGLFLNWLFVAFYSYPLFSHGSIHWAWLILLLIVFLLLPVLYFFVAKYFAIQNAIAIILNKQKPALVELLSTLLSKSMAAAPSKTPAKLMTGVKQLVSRLPYMLRLTLKFFLSMVPFYELLERLVAQGIEDPNDIHASVGKLVDEAEQWYNEEMVGQAKLFLILLFVVNVIGIALTVIYL